MHPCLGSILNVFHNKIQCILLLYKCRLRASVDTEMCCPKGKCGCQYFILLTLKKKKFMGTGVLDLFFL